jgi:hypothetical protein
MAIYAGCDEFASTRFDLTIRIQELQIKQTIAEVRQATKSILTALFLGGSNLGSCIMILDKPHSKATGHLKSDVP